MAEIKVGEQLPTFRLQDQDEAWVESSSFLGNPFVIYFYPKDDTPGCTAQACSFRDNFEEFKDLGAKVIGVSADTPASHKAFAKKYRLPFTLLSDKGNALRKQFGVKGNLFGLIPGRVTYVFDAEGKLVYSFNSQMRAKQHMQEALDKIKGLTV